MMQLWAIRRERMCRRLLGNYHFVNIVKVAESRNPGASGDEPALYQAGRHRRNPLLIRLSRRSPQQTLSKSLILYVFESTLCLQKIYPGLPSLIDSQTSDGDAAPGE
jgi:hypothetical protein